MHVAHSAMTLSSLSVPMYFTLSVTLMSLTTSQEPKHVLGCMEHMTCVCHAINDGIDGLCTIMYSYVLEPCPITVAISNNCL